MHTRVLPDLVEAASRSGRRDDAAEALELLRLAGGRGSARRSALGVLARAEALMADGTRRPRVTTARPSSAWRGPRARPIWPAPTSSTASGCAVSDAAPTPATSSASRTTGSPRWVPPASPSGPASSWRRRGSGSARAPWRPPRPHLAGAPDRDARRRGPHQRRDRRRGSSSARRPSTTTCARCTGSSTSVRGASCAAAF